AERPAPARLVAVVAEVDLADARKLWCPVGAEDSGAGSRGDCGKAMSLQHEAVEFPFADDELEGLEAHAVPGVELGRGTRGREHLRAFGRIRRVLRELEELELPVPVPHRDRDALPIPPEERELDLSVRNSPLVDQVVENALGQRL